jgi:hypothetical protein
MTAVVAITTTNDLQGFSESSWLVTAYMLTYVGKQTRCNLVTRPANDATRLHDHLGKTQRYFRPESVRYDGSADIIVFSGACGAAQTITQL